MKKILTLLLVFSLVSGVFSLGAVSADTKNCQITLTIPELYTLTLADATLAAAAQTPDITAGYIDLDQTSATCTANRGWKLTLETTGFAPVSGYTKPVSDVEILTTGSYDTTYAARTAIGAINTPYEVSTYIHGVLGDVTNIDYRILLSTSDLPGSYVITFVYTLASNA